VPDSEGLIVNPDDWVKYLHALLSNPILTLCLIESMTGYPKDLVIPAAESRYGEAGCLQTLVVLFAANGSDVKPIWGSGPSTVTGDHLDEPAVLKA
jgi:hypothetical protein